MVMTNKITAQRQRYRHFDNDNTVANMVSILVLLASLRLRPKLNFAFVRSFIIFRAFLLSFIRLPSQPLEDKLVAPPDKVAPQLIADDYSNSVGDW